MTDPSSRRDAGGGAIRPSRSRTARAVVALADPEIRDGWARALEASGLHVMRCAGPGVDCILLRGADRCPLLDTADVALYEESSLTDAFVERLRASRVPAMIIAGRDRHRMDGDHEPAMSRVVPSGL